jgi:hypothetical protein
LAVFCHFDIAVEMCEVGDMADDLHVYQYEKHPLVTITDGRRPPSLPENEAGWILRERIAATPEGIVKVATMAPSKVLDAIAREGYCSLNNFEIVESWRLKWVKAA